MNDDCIYFFAIFSGLATLILTLMLACATTTKETAQRHHRHARDLYGRVTCEYCKELMKGVSHEQH